VAGAAFAKGGVDPKQTKSYASLTEAIESLNAENPSESDLRFVQRQRFTASDGAASDYFGYSVAVFGDTAVIGAYGNLSARGAAYIFVRTASGWTQQAKLTANNNEAGDLFGRSVAISGDTVIVGAPQKTINGNINQGAAYVFRLGGASPFDFDGDGKADPAIRRPSIGQWWYLRSSDSSNRAFSFGVSTDNRRRRLHGRRQGGHRRLSTVERFLVHFAIGRQFVLLFPVRRERRHSRTGQLRRRRQNRCRRFPTGKRDVVHAGIDRRNADSRLRSKRRPPAAERFYSLNANSVKLKSSKQKS
jgi:hypothetical protein